MQIEKLVKQIENRDTFKKIFDSLSKKNNEKEIRTLLVSALVHITKKKNFKLAYEFIQEIEEKYKNDNDLNLVKLDVIEGLGEKKEALNILQNLVNSDQFKSEKFSLMILRKLINYSKYEPASLYTKKYLTHFESYSPAWPYILRVALQVADWDVAEKIISNLKNDYAKKTTQIHETPRTHLLWNDDQKINNRVISAFSEKNYPLKELNRPKYSNKKIRVGYISYDFRDHPTSLLFMGLLRHHNHELFDIYGYCLSYDDGSALRRDIQARFKSFKHVQSLTDEQIANTIKEDQIDILVDLNGLTEGSRYKVFAYKPAGVIISYLGFPGSVGNRFIDYVVGDDYTIPEHLKKYYPEKIIRLPWTYQINDYRSRYLPPKGNKPPHPLISNGPILGVFNNINKIRRECWDVWLDIMEEVKHAQLWLLHPGELAKKNILRYTAKKGIDEKRIIFVPKMKQDGHAKRLQWCDLMLDPWPYGGHTTTSDAIFAGVPVVTMPGNNFASRVSAGLLKAAYLDEMVAKNVDEYKRIAVNAISDLVALRRKKQQIIDQKMTMPIFDSVKRTVEIERAYIEIYKRYKNNEDFVGINIKQSKGIGE